jgi:hypothetical protein
MMPAATGRPLRGVIAVILWGGSKKPGRARLTARP